MTSPAPALGALTSAAAPAVCVGRDEDLRRLADLFGEGERLVTLVGGGGIGKTVVAVEYGRTVAGDLAVHLCDLSEARDEADLCDVVARALEVPPSADRSGTAPEQIGRVLSARGACLLILDNVEQMLGPVAGAVTRWLTVAPQARFLITSREPVGVRAEVRHELGPLALPAHPAHVERSDAGRLLLARIRRARRDYEWVSGDLGTAAELLARLDGIPLAIELAAPRVAALGLGAVLARLPGGALDLLHAGPRDAADRHATLRATIAWSWSLLAAHEQAALAQCATFRGGFTLDAAEHVVDLSPYPAAPPVVDVIQALREKSLLVTTRPPDAAAERFAPYFAVRELSEERLADWPAESPVRRAAERHAAYHVARGEHCARGARRTGGPALLAELRGDRDNLRAVAERALAATPPDATLAARALLALWPLVWLDGVYHAFSPLLDAALALLPADLPLALDLRLARAEIAWRSARYPAAHADFDVVEPVVRAREDRIRLGLCQLERGYTFVREGRPRDAARALAVEAVATAEENGDSAQQVEAIRLLAGIVQDAGDVEQAWRLNRRACDIAECAGDVPVSVGVLVHQGVLELIRGDLARSAACLSRAMSLNAQVGYRPLGAYALGWIGIVDLIERRLEPAVARLDEAAATLASVARGEYEGFFRAYLGAALSELGRAGEARSEIDRARALLPSGHWLGEAPLPLAMLGMIEAREGRADDAAAAFREAAAVETRLRDAWRHALDLYAGHVELAAGDLAAARARLATAATVPAGAPRGTLPLVERSILIRLAYGVLHQAVEAAAALRAPRAAGSSRARNPSGQHVRAAALLVHERGDWFMLPGGRRIDCRDRQAPRRMLALLAQTRHSVPGRAVPVDALVEAGWPGEHMAWDAALNRLRVAINILRRLGLRTQLRNERGGYLLDPDLPIQLVPSATDSPPG